MKVLHVITALNVGGAEAMLAKLMEQERRADAPMESHVLSLMRPGKMARRIVATGVPLHSLDMTHGLPLPWHPPRLARAVRAIAPDVIVGWMYHGQLAASLAAMMVRPHPPVIWNVRHSVDDLRQEKRVTRGLLRLGALLSKTPRAIIYNSHAAEAQYRRIGFHDDRAIVIPNGFESEAFQPDPAARERLAGIFGIDPKTTIVGMIARAHPMKDPATLIRAVSRARDEGADIHLLIAGAGMDTPSPGMTSLAASIPEDRLTLSGHRSDLASLLPGLDILALPSAWGEGFPNILGEAMASGVPCVATDVGDSGWIIGETGRTVPPRDPEAMAEALLELARLDPESRRALGRACRKRIVEHFSIGEVAGQYTGLYRDVLAESRGAKADRIFQSAAGAA